MTVRVVVADDQTIVRAGLRKLLESEPGIDVVGEAPDGLAAIDLARAARPDVVLMDIRMPRLDGLEATRRLTAAAVPTRVLVLTTYDRDEYVFEAVRAGASGFLLKDAPAEQLIAGVQLVAAGEALLAPFATRRLIEEFARQPGPGAAPAALAQLTPRERDVLELLGRGRSNREIAEDLVISGATVKTHVRNVLMKLDLRDRVQAVVLAYESGLIRPGDAA